LVRIRRLDDAKNGIPALATEASAFMVGRATIAPRVNDMVHHTMAK
jgi:hypothetical protein